MNRYLTSTVLSCILFSVAVAPSALAQAPLAYGVPTSYKVIVKDCQMSTDGGTTWVTLWTTGIEMDVASAAKGAEVLKFVQNLVIPSGTYNRLRYTVDKLMKVTGSVAHGGFTYYTSTGLTDGTTAPAVEYTFTNTTDTTYTDTVAVSVQAGRNTYARISFNIDQGLALYGVGVGVFKIYPNPVAPTITVQAPTFSVK